MIPDFFTSTRLFIFLLLTETSEQVRSGALRQGWSEIEIGEMDLPLKMSTSQGALKNDEYCSQNSCINTLACRNCD